MYLDKNHQLKHSSNFFIEIYDNDLSKGILDNNGWNEMFDKRY